MEQLAQLHSVETGLDPPEIERFKHAQSTCFRFGASVVASLMSEAVRWLSPQFFVPAKVVSGSEPPMAQQAYSFLLQ